MEFGEKLQQLRKQKEWTQEQLAEALFVSRAAISKWESGRGYPNIESLKSISKLFDITIDDLLSGEEVITIAQTENRSNTGKNMSLLYGILDLMALLFICLPCYGQLENGYIYSVSLFHYTDTTKWLWIVYFCILIVMIGIGIIELVLLFLEKEKAMQKASYVSFGVHSMAILMFASSRQPYVTLFLFCFFVLKVIFLIRQAKMK